MKSSLEIAQNAKPAPIKRIAKKIGLMEKELEAFGDFKAKVSLSALARLAKKKDGRLVLVTATTPTSSGEGKTTITIGLGQGLARLKKKTMICLRQPSMGPIFGVKGGATGGGYSQVLPMEDINIHFTGDIHAITSANNLLAAMLDNYVFYNKEKFGPNPNITWKRAEDMNDRSLRNIEICMMGNLCIPRNEAFQITAASEVMAVFCLSNSIQELKENLGKIVVGFDKDHNAVFCRDLRAHGAMTVILKDALNPNLVQSSEGVPAFVHGGPFANIAHGCNSIIATKMALKLADIVVTEAGFASELGMEKFFDIKCRKGKLRPSCVVIVTTLKALRRQGGAKEPKQPDITALRNGFANLEKHLENISMFGVPFVVAVNKFEKDPKAELEAVKEFCKSKGAKAIVCEAFTKGGKGCLELASEVDRLSRKKSLFRFLYDENFSLREKIETIARQMYGAEGAEFEQKAIEDIMTLEKNGLDRQPVCISKTQMSLSDNPDLYGRPSGYRIKIREVYPSNGAGFIVALSGQLISMPGLPKEPNAEKIDIDPKGRIKGLF
ncbi:MAG: formate--tetrahydrofolate ligase [Candidatus Diapherotrites archaeon]|nr:formate--tetrahydrofolate ligase [Candidatus Diapherotrites archaeon]